MNKLILIAGATGNLGQKICRELIKKNIAVRAIVRNGTDYKKVKALEVMGVDVFKVDFDNEQELIGISIGRLA
jgi:uncharacterized protein YbjT (DUF2867 family)